MSEWTTDKPKKPGYYFAAKKRGGKVRYLLVDWRTFGNLLTRLRCELVGNDECNYPLASFKYWMSASPPIVFPEPPKESAS